MYVGHVHISRGITKLGQNIPSVSLPPGITCREGVACSKLCYARKGRFAFKHNKELLQRNLDVWLNDPEGYERDITIAAFTSRFFRYHSAGDIPDENYIKMMVRVANVCPCTSFLCFTKKYELVDKYITENGQLPENLNIIYSAWGDLVPDNPYKMPVAYIRFKKTDTYIPENAIQCSGYCGACVQTGKSCWNLKSGTADCVVFDQH